MTFKKLAIGRIVFVDEEQYLCDIYAESEAQTFTKVPLSFGYVGSRAMVGVMPEEGSQALLGWVDDEVDSSPRIITYIAQSLDKYNHFQPIATTDGFDTFAQEEDLYIGNQPLIRTKRGRKLYPGDALVEASQGGSIYVSDDISLSNQRLNEIELRAADQSIRTNSLINTTRAAGYKAIKGLVVRNDEEAWLKSLKKSDEEIDPAQITTELNTLRKNHAMVLPDGKFQYIVTLNKANEDEASLENEATLDKQQRDYIGTLTAQDTPPGFWEAPVTSPATSAKEVPPLAFTENRLEMVELHNGIIDVDEDLLDFDVENEEESPTFFVRNYGTLISNDPSSILYGRVLIDDLFLTPYSSHRRSDPYTTSDLYAEESYAELTNLEAKLAAKQIVEERYASTLHLSFPLNGTIVDRAADEVKGGINPPVFDIDSEGIEEALSWNIDSYYWGGQIKTTNLIYNPEQEPSYTRFDILKTGNILFNIAASDSKYGELKASDSEGITARKSPGYQGAGPLYGAGVSFADTTDNGPEKLQGWSIEGNVEGGSKLILGRDFSRRISLLLQTYGMIYGTIGSDFPAGESNNPQAIGTNNSFNLKIEGKGRIIQGKNVKDHLSMEYRSDGRHFIHLGSAGDGEDTYRVKVEKGEDSEGNEIIVEAGEEILYNDPNGSITNRMFNQPGGLVYRGGNTSLEFATDGAIIMPFIGKDNISHRSVTIFTEGSFELGNELEPIGENNPDNSQGAGDVDRTFGNSLCVYTKKGAKMRLGQPDALANTSLASTGKYKDNNDRVQEYERLAQMDVAGNPFDEAALDLEIFGNVNIVVHGDEYRRNIGNVYWEVDGVFTQHVKNYEDETVTASTTASTKVGPNGSTPQRRVFIGQNGKDTLVVLGKRIVATTDDILIKTGSDSSSFEDAFDDADSSRRFNRSKLELGASGDIKLVLNNDAGLTVNSTTAEVTGGSAKATVDGGRVILG